MIFGTRRAYKSHGVRGIRCNKHDVGVCRLDRAGDRREIALSRAPSVLFLPNSASAPTNATVCGFGFCAAATSKNPRENSRLGVRAERDHREIIAIVNLAVGTGAQDADGSQISRGEQRQRRADLVCIITRHSSFDA
jgi:hypothetical protein